MVCHSLWGEPSTLKGYPLRSPGNDPMFQARPTQSGVGSSLRWTDQPPDPGDVPPGHLLQPCWLLALMLGHRPAHWSCNPPVTLTHQPAHQRWGPVQDVLSKLSWTAAGELSPMAAIFGGIVGQEAMKAISGKFHPIHQFLYFDAVEALPASPPSLPDLSSKVPASVP